MIKNSSGEGEIRTLGGDKPHNGFRDRPIKPLWHLSERENYISIFRRRGN